jgi:hypothetical protein
MVLVSLTAIGFAALRNPSDLYARLVYTATLIVLLSGILGSLFSRVRIRVAWVGFTLFAWSYFLNVVGRPEFGEGIQNGLVTTHLLSRLEEAMHPLDETKLSGLEFDSQRVMFREKQDRRTRFYRIGDSLTFISFGLLGVVLGRVIVTVGGRRESARA